MIDMKNTRVVDLTWEITSRLTRLDGSIEAGTRDVYNMPWIVEETINERDGTIEHLVGSNRQTIAEWPIGGVSGTYGLAYSARRRPQRQLDLSARGHARSLGYAALHLLWGSRGMQPRSSRGAADFARASSQRQRRRHRAVGQLAQWRATAHYCR
jgi:hypothetical protein